MDWLNFGRRSEKELDAFRMRKLEALIDSIPISTPAHIPVPVDEALKALRMKELDRIYRALEAEFDALVLVHDKLVGNPARGCRGDYYFTHMEQLVHGIRRMRQYIIDKHAEIAIERENIEAQRRARTYGEDTEAEINAICAAYNIQGLKTL